MELVGFTAESLNEKLFCAVQNTLIPSKITKYNDYVITHKHVTNHHYNYGNCGASFQEH